MPTATSATDSVVSSSSTMPDRNAMRSVPIVASRCASPSGAHPSTGTALPPVRAQRGQAGEQVEDLGTEPLHGDQALLGPTLREPPDQDHEDRDERQHHHEDRRGDPVEPEHHEQDARRHRRREHQLRQVPHEVRLERVEPAGGQRDHRRTLAGGQPPRPERHGVRHDLLAQLGDRPGGRAVREALLHRGDQRPDRDDGREPRDRRAQDVQRGAVRDGGAQRVREQQRLRDDQRRRDHAERRGQGDVPAGRSGVPEQARVQGPHRSAEGAGTFSNVRPVWSGIRSAEIRLRNTQYVQPW